MSPHLTLKTLAATAATALVLAACSGGGSGDDPVSADQARSADPAESAVTVPDEAALRAVLDRWRTDVDAYGASLSLRVPDHGDIHVASGVDDRDPETPMPTDGTFEIASVTKSFVAAAALQLVEEGRLSLDEPVAPWLPELPRGDEITLDMLLGHTSGLGEWDAAGAILEDLNRTFTLEEVLTNHGQAAPYGEPGELFAYSNANYTAIGAMIERELDQDLAAVIEAGLTGPLALDDTWYVDTTAIPTRHGWYGLDPSDSERMIDTVYTVFPAALSLGKGAGGLASSSDDLLDWGEALYSGEVLGDDATAAMVDMRSAFVLDPATDRLVAADEPTPLHYGLGTMGWCLDARGCAAGEVDLVGHSGSVDGTRVLVGHHAASGTTIAVHANVGRIPQLQLVALLADVFAEMGIEPRSSEQHP